MQSAGTAQTGRVQGGIGAGQVFRQTQKMQVGPVIEQRGARGDADGDGELLGETAQGLRQQQFTPAPIMGNRRKVPHAEGERREAEHHQPQMPATQAVARMVSSPNQSQRGPSSSVYSRQPRNKAIVGIIEPPRKPCNARNTIML